MCGFLKGFMANDIAEKDIFGNVIINKLDIESDISEISDIVLDELADLQLVKQYLTEKACRVVEKAVRKKDNSFKSGNCEKIIETQDSKARDGDNLVLLQCSYCLTWYHLRCVLRKGPKGKLWWYQNCKSKD